MHKAFKRSVPLWAVVLVVILTAVSVAFAIIQFTIYVTNTMKLQPDYTIAVFQEDGVTPLTAIDWDDYVGDDTKTYYFKIKNIGNVKVDFSWSSADFPPEWQVEMYVGSSEVLLPEDTLASAVGYTSFAPNMQVPMRIDLTEVSATAGVDYGFTLALNSHEFNP